MKKTVLLLLGLAIALTTYSQDHGFRFGVCVNPNLSGNFLSSDGSVPAYIVKSYKNTEHSTFGYSGYVFTHYPIRQRFNMRYGAGYSNSGYASKKQKTNFAVPEPTLPEYTQFSWTSTDIIIPLLLQYNFSKRAHHFYLIGGWTIPINLRRTKTLKSWYATGQITTDKQDDNSTDFRKSNVNGTLGMGYDLKISSKMSLLIQPTFDCNIFGISKSTGGLNRRMYSLGLNVGLLFG